jgi:hypothetical protein
VFPVRYKLYILPTQCICVFRMVLTINSDRFPYLCNGVQCISCDVGTELFKRNPICVSSRVGTQFLYIIRMNYILLSVRWKLIFIHIQPVK